jgi:type IV secretion system protein TrbF
MRFFKSKKQIALSPLPGGYNEEDPEGVIFDTGTRLRVEANHWKIFSFVLAAIALGAVWTRQPPPSVVKSYGVAADAGGHPLIRQLTAYKPEDQALRTSMKDSVTAWFTIEPILADSVENSRMKHNIDAVKAQMTGNARNQFADWLKNDAPYQAITLNPKLVREVHVTAVSLLDASTAVVEFTTSTTQNPTDKPVVKHLALTWRYQIVPPSADDAITTNPFGIFYPLFTLEETHQ